MTGMRVPFHRPSVGEPEAAAVAEVLSDGWLTSGPRVRTFEEACADYLRTPHALALSSGTAALELALILAGIGPGHEVITTANTFIATIEAIWSVGATPVLADVDPITGLVEPEEMASRIGDATRALMPVHLGGQPTAMTEIVALAAGHDLVVIDDAAHAFEAESDAGKIGAVGDFTAFSFYANKNLTCGEGGLLTCRRADDHRRGAALRNHGIDRDAWTRAHGKGFRFYDVSESGLKANLSDLAAAVGIRQMERLDELRRKRLEVVAAYDEGLGDVAGLRLPSRPERGVHAWHLYALSVEVDRDAFIDGLHDLGVGCSIHYKPLHLLTEPARRLGVGRGAYPGAERYYRGSVSIPLYPAMSDDDVAFVIESVRDVMERLS